jgi:hypothetical protein
MSSSVGMTKFPTEWTNKIYVPNHQPDMDNYRNYIYIDITGIIWENHINPMITGIIKGYIVAFGINYRNKPLLIFGTCFCWIVGIKQCFYFLGGFNHHFENLFLDLSMKNRDVSKKNNRLI